MTAANRATACRVSVVIKALNEQDDIADAVSSALGAVAQVGGEVVLADSGSRDRTLEIASAFPIRIVQLREPRDRSCGAGAQLGWQHARGEYVYVMDGDMVLAPGFLEEALAVLAQHPEVAGVGGHVRERQLASLEYRERDERQARGQPHRLPGVVDRLDGGALYRRRAIEEVGYLADRNLHSYEEFELAVRLRHRGWKLWRSPLDAVSHHGHTDPAACLLLRRWRSGYAWGCGELLRSALGQPWLRLVLRDLRELRLYGAVWLWWLALASTPWWPVPEGRAPVFAVLLLAPVAGMAWRKRSWTRAAYAVASWCVQSAGLARGLLRRRRPPGGVIASRILREPDEPTRPVPGAGPGRAWLRPTPPSAHRS